MGLYGAKDKEQDSQLGYMNESDSKISKQIKSNTSAISSNTTNINKLITGKSFNLPTSNPGVAGALWNDAGTVKVSTG